MRFININKNIFPEQSAQSDQISSASGLNTKKLLRKAINEFNQKHYGSAYTTINKLIDYDPNIPRAWSLLGEIKQVLYQDYQASEADCIHAININPDNLNSYFILLTIYKKQRSYTKMLQLTAYLNHRVNSILKVRFAKVQATFSQTQKHFFSKEVYNHINQDQYLQLVRKGERLLSYWLSEFIWDRYEPDKIRQLPGPWNYGYGYILLTDIKVYFVNLGDLTKMLFNPGTHTSCIFPGEPTGECIEEKSIINEIGYRNLVFANGSYDQPIINGRIWNIHLLNDYEDVIAFLGAIKSGLSGRVDKYFEPLSFLDPLIP